MGMLFHISLLENFAALCSYLEPSEKALEA